MTMRLIQPVKKVCWFGIYDKAYSRNDILMAGLRENGIEIVECSADPKDPHRYLTLVKKLKALKGDYDIIYAAYPAPVPAIVAKLFSRKPVWMDAFYSMYDAVVNDRSEITRFHPRAIKLAVVDWLGLMMADKIIVDTEEHKKYWSRWPFVREAKIRVVYLGVNPETFHPAPANGEDQLRKKFLVHWNGTYIPLHGVDKIVASAELLKDDRSIKFRLVGSGGDSERTAARIRSSQLDNIELVGRVPIDTLNAYMSDADVILGIFGDTAKARRVIPNKVYEGMAVRKPVITMDTPAMREAFTDEDALLTDNDPRSIVAAIKRVQSDGVLREKLARRAYESVMNRFSPQEVVKWLFY